MKKIFLLFIGLTAGLSVFAQTDLSRLKTFSDGALTWDDFSKRKSFTDQNSDLYFFITYNAEKQKINDTVLYRNVLKCYIDKDSSWVDTSKATNADLAYHRVVYDMIEVFRRKLQPEIDKLKKQSEIDALIDSSYRLFSNKLADFRKEVQSTHNLELVNAKAEKTKSELSVLKENYIPKYENAKFGLGANFGFGAAILTSNLSDYFVPELKVIIGFDLSYGHSMLYFNFANSGVKIKKNHDVINDWNTDSKLALTQLELAYGFRVLDGKDWKLSPFVGYSRTDLSTANKNEGKKNMSYKDDGIFGGLCVDYKFRTSYNLANNMRLKEKQELSVRAKIYVSYLDFNSCVSSNTSHSDLSAWMLNFALELSAFDKFIKIK